MDIDVCALNEIEGCLDRLTPMKKSKHFNSEQVGLFCGYFYRQLSTTCLKLDETVTY